MSRSAADSFPTVCISVLAAVEPGVMPRVLEQFAKRNMVPSQWHSAVGGPQRDELWIDIQVEGMAPPLAEQVAAALRQLVHVEWVATSEKAAARSA